MEKQADFDTGLNATKYLAPFRPVAETLGMPENEASDAIVAAGMAAPLAGGIAGSIAGNGALSGVARTVGTVGGAGLGYMGANLLNNYLSDKKFFKSLDSNYRDIAKLALQGGGALLGGLGGYNLTKRWI